MHFSHCRPGRRKTDFCAHCHLMEAWVLPSLWRDIADFRAELCAVYPPYFNQLDASQVAQEALDKSDALGYGERFVDHVDQFIDRNRAALSSKGPYRYIPQLHEMSAKACHVLRWSLRVVRAHEWHRRPLAPQSEWQYSPQGSRKVPASIPQAEFA